MDDLTTKVGVPGLSGAVGMMLGWFGLRTRIKSVEKSVCNLKTEVRFEITCDKVHEALNLRLASMEGLHKESRDDIKEILRRIPQK